MPPGVTSSRKRAPSSLTTANVWATSRGRKANPPCPGTTIAAVADQADVAVQTVYASFGTKRALLAAAIDVAIAGDDEPVPVDDRPWMRPVWEAADEAGTLRAYAAAVCLIQSRVALLFRALEAGAAAEPELRQLHEETSRRRRLGRPG
ncbi:MAG: TetR family transcriptional regulator [Acidimicrobiia bacterium]|nr:TetR family transcriptional regulator [Acidimicrobiia bacterium]